MMNTETKAKPAANHLNKVAYAAFVITGIFFLVTRDFSQAVIFWGLALIFDPFDTKVPYGKRPLYQKTWLIVHTLITFGLFVLLLQK